MSHKPVILLDPRRLGINPVGRNAAVANGDATLLARTPFPDRVISSWYRRGVVRLRGWSRV